MKKNLNFFWVLLFFAHSFVYTAEWPINERSNVLEKVAFKELEKPELFFDIRFEKFVINTISKEKILALNSKECFTHTFDLFKQFVSLEPDKEGFRGFVEYFARQVLVPVGEECDLFPDKCILELPIDQLLTIVTKEITTNSSRVRSSFFPSSLSSSSEIFEKLSDEQVFNYCEFAHIICKNFYHVTRYVKATCDAEYTLKKEALAQFRLGQDRVAAQNKLVQQESSPDVNCKDKKILKAKRSVKKKKLEEDCEDRERLVYFDDRCGLLPVSYKSYSLISEIFKIYGEKAGCIDSFGSTYDPIDISSIAGMRLFLILLDSINSKELGSDFGDIIDIITDGNWTDEEHVEKYWQLAGLVLRYAKTIAFEGQLLSYLLVLQLINNLYLFADDLGKSAAQDLTLRLLSENFDLMEKYKELFEEFLP